MSTPEEAQDAYKTLAKLTSQVIDLGIALTAARRTTVELGDVRDRLRLIAQLHWGQGGPDHEHTWCTDSECSICAILLCPFGEPLHYHHDGCPACHYPELTTRPLIDWRTYY